MDVKFMPSVFSARCIVLIKLATLVLITQSLLACSSVSYISHLISGQVDLLWKRQSIGSLLEDETLNPKLKERLVLASEITRFAEESLGLPVDDAYSSYSDLERPYASWSVYVAPELSLESYKWCYTFIGCVAYRVYLDKEMAKSEGDKFIKEGYDVRVGGVRAYSTVGFFDDPLLNTFIFESEHYLVDILIHEITHRQLYIKNDTKFSENFATAVAFLGVEQWYSQAGRSDLFSEYQANKKRYQTIISLLLSYKIKLEEMYANEDITVEIKRLQKKEVLHKLDIAYQSLRDKEGWDKRYDHWVANMNNATLSTLSNYEELVPSFVGLFKYLDGDWQKFYDEAERISELEKTARYAELRQYAKPYAGDH